MAPITPEVPTWANSLIFSVVAAAAMAALLSKPQIGSRLMPLALLLTRAATNSVKTQVTSSELKMVCTMPAFLTPIIFRYPNRIRMADASSISPI